MNRPARWLRRLLFGSLVIACLASLYGCPLLEIIDDVIEDVPGTSETFSVISMIVRYRVIATMQDNNGTYTTVHETQIQDLYELDENDWEGDYDPQTRTYIGSFMRVSFNENFTEVTDLRSVAEEEVTWPVHRWKEDGVIAARIPRLGNVADYDLGDTYLVFRSASPCDVISELRYERLQYSEPVFRTTMTSFVCDTESYIDFAIVDPKFGER